MAFAGLQEDRVKAQAEKKKAEEERRTAEWRAQELQAKHQSLQELLSTLKDGKGAQKVTLIAHYSFISVCNIHFFPDLIRQTGPGVAQETGRKSHTRVKERPRADSPEGGEPVPEKPGGRAREKHLQAGKPSSSAEYGERDVYI